MKKLGSPLPALMFTLLVPLHLRYVGTYGNLCTGRVLNYIAGAVWKCSLLLARRSASYNVRQTQGRVTNGSKQLNRQTAHTVSTGMLVKAARETDGSPNSELCAECIDTLAWRLFCS